jgi:ankyrin repeat protein
VSTDLFSHDPQIIQSAIVAGEPLDVPNFRGDLPVHTATRKNRSECAALLITAESPLDVTDYIGYLPIHYTTKWGNTELTKLLISSGSPLQESDQTGQTPVHLAATHGVSGVLALLLKAGCQVNIPDHVGQLPIHQASRFGDLDTVKILIEAGSPLDHEDRAGLYPLQVAIMARKSEVVRLLFAHGSPIETPGGDTWSTLDYALLGAQKQMIRILFDNGVTPACPGKLLSELVHDLMPEIHRTLLAGEKKKAHSLIKGSDETQINEQGPGGLTPLMIACALGYLPLSKRLIARGADIHQGNIRGNQAIHMAVIARQTAMYQYLLSAGADHRAENHQGQSAAMLHIKGTRPQLFSASGE